MTAKYVLLMNIHTAAHSVLQEVWPSILYERFFVAVFVCTVRNIILDLIFYVVRRFIFVEGWQKIYICVTVVNFLSFLKIFGISVFFLLPSY